MRYRTGHIGGEGVYLRRPPRSCLLHIIYKLFLLNGVFSLLAFVIFMSACDNKEIKTENPQDTPQPEDSVALKVYLRMPGGEAVGCLDIFAYTADQEQKLLSHKRIEYARSSECELREEDLEVPIVPTGLEINIIAIANSPYAFNTKVLAKYESLEKVQFQESDDSAQLPIMSGTGRIAINPPLGEGSRALESNLKPQQLIEDEGFEIPARRRCYLSSEGMDYVRAKLPTKEGSECGGVEVPLMQLGCRIIIAAISNYVGADVRLDNIHAGLTWRNPSAEILRVSGFRPVEPATDTLWTTIPGSVERQTQRPGTELRCLPSDSEEQSIGTPRTCLVLEMEINEGYRKRKILCHKDLPPLPRGCCIMAEISIESDLSGQIDFFRL